MIKKILISFFLPLFLASFARADSSPPIEYYKPNISAVPYSNGPTKKMIGQDGVFIWIDLGRNHGDQVQYYNPHNPSAGVRSLSGARGADGFYGSNLVYIAVSGSGIGIYIYNIDEQREYPIVCDEYRKGPPSIWENKVVWNSEIDGIWDAHMYNIDTGSSTKLTDGSFDVWYPKIYGDHVAWIDGLRGFDHRQMYGYDLNNPSRGYYPVSSIGPIDNNYSFSDNALVWQNKKYPGKAMYYDFDRPDYGEKTYGWSDNFKEAYTFQKKIFWSDETGNTHIYDVYQNKILCLKSTFQRHNYPVVSGNYMMNYSPEYNELYLSDWPRYQYGDYARNWQNPSSYFSEFGY